MRIDQRHAQQSPRLWLVYGLVFFWTIPTSGCSCRDESWR